MVLLPEPASSDFGSDVDEDYIDEVHRLVENIQYHNISDHNSDNDVASSPPQSLPEYLHEMLENIDNFDFIDPTKNITLKINEPVEIREEVYSGNPILIVVPSPNKITGTVSKFDVGDIPQMTPAPVDVNLPVSDFTSLPRGSVGKPLSYVDLSTSNNIYILIWEIRLLIVLEILRDYIRFFVVWWRRHIPSAHVY